MAGIYVHVPFCSSKCAYCDFYSGPFPAALQTKYVESVIAEYRSRRKEINGQVNTIYFGGGTPSALSQQALDRLFNALPTQNIQEYTIEVNPEDVTPTFVNWLISSTPVNRVSMGVQTLNDRLLQFLHRRHNAAQAINAAELIASAGLNLSLDLIYGLPGQTVYDWQNSLNSILHLHPHHLSCYLLSYEPGTLLSAMKTNGKVTEADEDTVIDMYTILCESAAAQGYNHYEISNFALPGHRAIHNSGYWNFTPYLGLGPGAHSFDGSTRSYNPTSLKQYLNCSGVGFTITEPESPQEKLNDYILTALRTCDGIRLDFAETHFGAQTARRILSIAQSLHRSGLVNIDLQRIYIPEERLLLSDSIILRFIDT